MEEFSFTAFQKTYYEEVLAMERPLSFALEHQLQVFVQTVCTSMDLDAYLEQVELDMGGYLMEHLLVQTKRALPGLRKVGEGLTKAQLQQGYLVVYQEVKNHYHAARFLKQKQAMTPPPLVQGLWDIQNRNGIPCSAYEAARTHFYTAWLDVLAPSLIQNDEGGLQKVQEEVRRKARFIGLSEKVLTQVMTGTHDGKSKTAPLDLEEMLEIWMKEKAPDYLNQVLPWKTRILASLV